MVCIVWKINKAIPRYTFRILSLSIFLLCVLFTGNSKAAPDNLSLLVNGKSIHMNKTANASYNETNWGFGLQYEFAKSGPGWVPFATVSGFKDSNSQASYYAGGGYMRRVILLRKFNQLHVDAGLVGFVMSRQDFQNGEPFVGALPALSLGTRDVSVNVTYIPKVHPKITELVFFQLKLSTRSLK